MFLIWALASFHDDDAIQPRTPASKRSTNTSDLCLECRVFSSIIIVTRHFFSIQFVSVQSLSCPMRHESCRDQLFLIPAAVSRLLSPLAEPRSLIRFLKPSSDPTDRFDQPLCQWTSHSEQHREDTEGGHRQRRVRCRVAVLFVQMRRTHCCCVDPNRDTCCHC